MSWMRKALADLATANDRIVELEARLAASQAQVSRLTDALDMMRDEFKRIVACPGCSAEIEDLANRAQENLIQHVPVIVQRDRAELEAQYLRAENARLQEDAARLDWLENRGPWESWNRQDETPVVLRKPVRASIDAARTALAEKKAKPANS